MIRLPPTGQKKYVENIPNPCKTCICYAVCKAQIKPYLNKTSFDATLGVLQTIDKKCDVIGKIAQEYRKHSTEKRLLILVAILVHKFFGDDDEFETTD